MIQRLLAFGPPFRSIRIVKEDKSPAQPGEPGELWISGRGGALNGSIRHPIGSQAAAEEAGGSADAAKIECRDNNIGYRTFDHQMKSRRLVAGICPKITDKWDYFDVKAELPKPKRTWRQLSGPKR
jgi:hypothetical protein